MIKFYRIRQHIGESLLMLMNEKNKKKGRKQKMKNRKIVVVAFLVVAVMLLGVGYAALTDTLTIIGNAHIDLDKTNSLFDERIKFTSADVIDSTGKGTTADVASFNADDATFTVNSMAEVNDKSVFLFTITSESNVDAKITVNEKKLSGDVNPSNSNAKKFKVEYAYPQGTELAAGESITVQVTVTLIESVVEATSATFGIEYTATSVDPAATETT